MSKEIQNIYALDKDGNSIYIDDVISGRKGYYCRGCKREMEAVKSKLANRRSYFRHCTVDVEGVGKCTYSDETYRHALAKSMLQELKSVVGPAVYKYPPKGVKGNGYLLSQSKTIYADKVEIEIPFYEDENCEIHYGKNLDIDEKYLFIKPDVAFFDSSGKLILLIELVATHKIKDEKKLKIKRLGIDTIQINVPKASPEEIEESLKTTKHTKWIYNNEEANTTYIQPAESSATGISPIDVDQRRLFEETFNCRKVGINNLIRSIEKCLRTEYFRGIESGIGSEISRVEGNTETRRERLSIIQRECEKRLQGEHAEEINKTEERYRDLEERYLAKNGEIRRGIEEQRDIERENTETECRNNCIVRKKKIAIKTILQEQKKWDERAEKNYSTESEIRELEDRERKEFEFNERAEREYFKRTREGIKNNIRELQEKGRTISQRFGELTRKEQDDFERQKRNERQEIIRIESEERGLSKSNAVYRERHGTEFESRRETIFREVKEGNSGKYGALSKEIQRYFNGISLLNDISELYTNKERQRIALKAIRYGMFKNGNK